MQASNLNRTRRTGAAPSFKQALRTLTIATTTLLLACTDPNPQTSPEEVQATEPAPVATDAQAGLAPAEADSETHSQYENLLAWTGDLDGMAERRVVRVLTVYSIARYFLDGAKESGLVKEASLQLETFLTKRYRSKPRIRVIIVPVARDQLVPALLQGKGDIIIAGLTATTERLTEIDFSEPATRPLSEILVTGPTAAPIDTIDDLAGKTLYLRQSSSYWESVETINQRFREEDKMAIRLQPVSELLEDDDLVEMVNAGLLPWVVVDDYKLAWWRELFTDITPREDIVFRAGAQLAWGMRKNSPQLMEALNTFLEDHREGTLIGNVLVNRYIRDFDWADKATSPQALEHHAELEPLFRKYSELYGFEPLMLAAQGYQESRLNQSARSRYGAIGVMQVKHSTAGDRNVGIENIEYVEPNIHAGTKYLAFLRDRYFADEDIDDQDRWLLALAAYNMGPKRMINLRNRALKLGYDPNIWFDNVELAAAKHVGREPVTYVGNIYKYYLAYTLSEAQLAKRNAARGRAGIDQPASAHNESGQDTRAQAKGD